MVGVRGFGKGPSDRLRTLSEVQWALASAVNPLKGQYDHVETDYTERSFLILKGDICVLLVSSKEVYASEVSAMRVSKLEYDVNEGKD